MKSFKATVEDYLTLRRSLGYKLKQTEAILTEFAEFLAKRRARCLTAALALEWATEVQGVSPTHHARRLGVIRLFAGFRKLTDPRTEVPPKYLLPYRPRRAIPHIYTDEEITKLLGAFRTARTTELRRQTFSTLFGLLVVTGCRVGEALRLASGDVDLQRGWLTIRQTKFGKSRLVPLHSTTVHVLKQYVRVRDASLRGAAPQSFFVSRLGNPVDASDFKRVFLELSKEIGLRKGDAKRGPRLHDLRHTFAVRTILSWYRDGAAVEALMPLLSTYLGHRKASDTYWYLTGVPELLSLAVRRLETAGGER
jgi:integrase/recombinase XerD